MMEARPAQAGAHIRPARTEDFDAIARVWRAAGLSYRPTGRETRAAFACQLGHFPDLYLVAEVGGEIVGVVLGSHDHRKGWINRLAVRPDRRGGGIGLALLQACDAAIRAHGIEIVSALIEEGNEVSMRLFERAGYVSDVPVRYYRKLDRPDV